MRVAEEDRIVVLSASEESGTYHDLKEALPGGFLHVASNTPELVRLLAEVRPLALIATSEDLSSGMLQLVRTCAPDTRIVLISSPELRSYAYGEEDALVTPDRLVKELPTILDRFRSVRKNKHAEALAVARGLSTTLAMRQVETVEHCERLAAYATLLARACGATTLIPELELGGLLHDVGMIAVADRFLADPRKLTEQEWAEVRRHPILGSEIIRNLPPLQPALDVVLYHHERWDGRGYPHHLAGEAIPLSARIFSVCDAYEAMTTSRPYREAAGDEEARDRIQQNIHSQFDPNVVGAFLNIPRDRWAAAGRLTT